MTDMTQAQVATASAQDPQWRMFLRALADEVDALTSAAERDDMLRAIGRRMARSMPIAPVASLDTLQVEINDTLETIGWGSARLELNANERALMIHHADLPRIGSLGTPPGSWLAAVLEGLYETWLATQPGSDPNLTIRREPGGTARMITLRFGRA